MVQNQTALIGTATVAATALQADFAQVDLNTFIIAAFNMKNTFITSHFDNGIVQAFDIVFFQAGVIGGFNA